jgi:hypothetical protein
MIPAAQAVRSLLAMKLIGTERKSHVMDLVMDQAIAVFAGINVVPKRSYLAAYSSRVDHRTCLRCMEAWLGQVEQAGLPLGPSFDNQVDLCQNHLRELVPMVPPRIGQVPG